MQRSENEWQVLAALFGHLLTLTSDDATASSCHVLNESSTGTVLLHADARTGSDIVACLASPGQPAFRLR
jgi:hypothetical protein